MSRFEQLKQRIDAQKARIAKAQGVKESIEAGWKQKFGTTDVEKVKEIRDKAEADRRKAQSDLDDLYSKAEAIVGRLEGTR